MLPEAAQGSFAVFTSHDSLVQLMLAIMRDGRRI